MNAVEGRGNNQPRQKLQTAGHTAALPQDRKEDRTHRATHTAVVDATVHGTVPGAWKALCGHAMERSAF